MTTADRHVQNTIWIDGIVYASSVVHNVPACDIRFKTNRRGPTIDAKFHAMFLVEAITGMDAGKVASSFGFTGKSHMNHVRMRVLNLWDCEKSYRDGLYRIGELVGFERKDIDGMVTRVRHFVADSKRPKR